MKFVPPTGAWCSSQGRTRQSIAPTDCVAGPCIMRCLYQEEHPDCTAGTCAEPPTGSDARTPYTASRPPSSFTHCGIWALGTFVHDDPTPTVLFVVHTPRKFSRTDLHTRARRRVTSVLRASVGAPDGEVADLGSARRGISAGWSVRLHKLGLPASAAAHS